MAVVLLSWIYIFMICACAGMGVMRIVKAQTRSLTRVVITGMILITVYVEYFSIIGKIGAAAHLLMAVAALAAGCLQRKKWREIWKKYQPMVCSWEGFFYLCFILLIAFFTSRGTFHTDTNIYHAQAIRLYEEYGLIKGMGNLQLHYAYNSAYLAFASFFSLRWLFGQSLHTTTGFVEVVMCLYAFHGLKNFRNHDRHIVDMMRVGILFYTLVILTGSMSPATDYTTMYFALFVLTAWCENMEQTGEMLQYAFLAVTAVFVATLKFSACVLMLLAIYPLVGLIKEKRRKEIGLCLGCGMVIMLPFLIRNFLISGWLLYPFNGIDIFQVKWKIPEEYLLVDANQIKVWGRCLYDVDKVEWPVRQWLPVWWEGQERYEQMLLGSVVIGSFLLLAQFVRRRIRREKIRWDYLALMVTIFVCLGVWFFMAPFIRYGLAFLLAVPMIAAGTYISEKKKGFYSVLTGGLMFCLVVSLSPYWDRYITDAGVFIKQNLTQPYYIFQKDYDHGEKGTYEMNGNIIYYSVEGEINDYYTFPSTCYKGTLERSTLMGNEIKDGFQPK